MYDEYHEYRVDTQRWVRWPKALIMTHEWSTNGHDRRLEQRRYVPDNYATQLEMESSRIKANAEYQKKLADVELEEAHEIRHNIERLRERVHEIAADRDRVETENLQLRQRVDKLIRILNNDYDLCIQWDGLRRFWYVGLTDDGVRKRYERDDENVKLRDLIFDMLVDEERGNTEEDTYYEHVRLAKELGIEVES